MKPWEISELHVLPIGDLRDHEEQDACWCRPTKKGKLVVHHSMDGREEYERGRPLQ